MEIMLNDLYLLFCVIPGTDYVTFCSHFMYMCFMIFNICAYYVCFMFYVFFIKINYYYYYYNVTKLYENI